MAIPGPEVSNRLKQKCRLTKVVGRHSLSTSGDCAFKETQPPCAEYTLAYHCSNSIVISACPMSGAVLFSRGG